jgi:signal transduction histidine kinase
MIDQLRIQQILINLLQNAIKFSPRDSVIFLKIDTVSDEGKFVKIAINVEDVGIGISKEDLPNMFNAYFKTSDANSQKVN